MGKVYFTPYGVGLGHASRLLILASNLKESGVDCRFSSFGEAENYINRHGFDCKKVPPVEFLWGRDGEFSVKSNITKIPRWITNLSIQINKEIEFLKRFSPNLIISDSRLSPLIAGRILGIPSILIINQIKLLLTPRLREFKAARFFETFNGEFMGKIWNTSNKILIPDLPPPYTVSEDTINNVKSTRSKIQYIGFITPKKNITDKNLTKVKNMLQLERTKPIVFVHISGPKETRKPVITKIIEACKSLDKFHFIFSEGKANGEIQPKRISNNIWYFEWCPLRDEIFSICDILIIRGGHTAISQAIQFGKPFISIPIDNHGEQLSNANKIEKLGIGKTLNSKTIDSNSILSLLNELIDNSDYRKNSNDMMEISNQLDGVQNIKDIVLSYI